MLFFVYIVTKTLTTTRDYLQDFDIFMKTLDQATIIYLVFENGIGSDSKWLDSGGSSAKFATVSEDEKF